MDSGVLSNYIEAHGQTFVPIAGYEEVEKALPQKPSVRDLRISEKDRACVLDLRPYCNQSPISIQESTSVAVSARIEGGWDSSIFSEAYQISSLPDSAHL